MLKDRDEEKEQLIPKVSKKENDEEERPLLPKVSKNAKDEEKQPLLPKVSKYENDEEIQPLLPKVSKRKGRVTIAVIALSNMCAWSCVSLLAPFFPAEAAKKDTSATIIGMIYSCSELVIFLASPVFGNMMSSISPSFFYITGLCVFGTCDVLFGWLNQSPPGMPFITICFAVRVVEAVGTASIMTASFAIVGNTFPDRIAMFYSILETVGGCGFMIGPAIGGGLYQVGGFGLPFWVLGGCVFLCGVASWAVLPTQSCVTRQTGPSNLALVRSQRVLYGSVCLIVSLIAFSIWTPVYAQHLQQYNLSQSVIGLIFVVPAASYALTCPFWGTLLDKNVPPLPLMTASLCCASLCLLFFGPAPFFTFVTPTLWLSITSLVILGIVTAPLVVSAMRSIVQGARDLGFSDSVGTYGLVGGIVQSSNCFGSFIAPMIGGALTESYGFGWMTVVGAILILLPVLIFSPYLIKVYRSRKSSGILRAKVTQSDSFMTLKGDNLETEPKTDSESIA